MRKNQIYQPPVSAIKTVAFFQNAMNSLTPFEPLTWLRQLSDKDFKRLSDLYDRMQDRYSDSKTTDVFISTVLGLSMALRLGVKFETDHQAKKEQALLYYINCSWAIEWIIDEKKGKPKSGVFDLSSKAHLRPQYDSNIPLEFYHYVK